MNSYDHTGAIDLGLFHNGEVRAFYNPDRDVLAFVLAGLPHPDDDTDWLVTLSRGYGGSVVKAREAAQAFYTRGATVQWIRPRDGGDEWTLSVSPPEVTR